MEVEKGTRCLWILRTGTNKKVEIELLEKEGERSIVKCGGSRNLRTLCYSGHGREYYDRSWTNIRKVKRSESSSQ